MSSLVPPESFQESEPRPLRDIFLALAEELPRTRNQLVKWGVRVPNESRLHQAEDSLRALAERGSLPLDDDEVRPAVNALWTASDFADIGEYLPAERVKSVRRELEQALQGPLWPHAGQRQSLQLQTQHWLGALFLHHGVRIEHVRFKHDDSRKAPEFMVERGLHKLGIEVKRPESVRRIEASVADARDKFLARDCAGGVVIEITDLLENTSSDQFVAKARELALRAYSTVWRLPNRGFHSGFERVIYVAVLGRGLWTAAGEQRNRLRASGIAFTAPFAQPNGGLRDFQGRWLQQTLYGAFNDVVARLQRRAAKRDSA